MRLDEIRTLLDCEVMCGEDLLAGEVRTCFAADLMSDVLAFGRSGDLLITGLATLQSIHTTHLAELKGVLYVNRKRPAPEVLHVAQRHGIPVLLTGKGLFEACGLLWERGLTAGHRP